MPHLKDTGWMNVFRNKTHVYATRDTLWTEGYMQTKRGWKKIFHENGNQKKAVVAIFLLGKINFKIKTVTRDKEGDYIIIKGSIQEDIIFVNIYAYNIEVPQYKKAPQYKYNCFIPTTIKGTLTPQLHQWTDHPNSKLINTSLKSHIRLDGPN